MDPNTYGTIENPVWNGKMAKSYEFKLDPFQATSVACIERNESVLVAAHTSAGKTAVAEYAIAKALKSNQRVVYTSPLKALSNQKYRELTEEFTDVGLMTGDVTLNPNAPCIVMTTEILRSMIYKGSELLREVAWVVFDEVHYMKDRERGVVWEEVIIFMPKDARMVFLSATLPNSFQFAEWIAAVHGAPCHVVSTDYRPTPLVHYAFPLGGKGLYLLVDDKGNFKADNFNKMVALLKESAGEDQTTAQQPPGGISTAGSRRGGGGGRVAEKEKAVGGKRRDSSSKEKKMQGPPVEEELGKLLHLLKDKDLAPVIIFSFNRRECEQYANLVGGVSASKKKSGSGGGGDSNRKQSHVAPLDFNTPEEKKSVEEIFNKAIAGLCEDDKALPCIRTMLPMLQRGVAVHHSGLLPILKEVVEILFQETLVKCLFSTETFAMGLNMPAKTVIFTTLTKFDGEETRFIESGEYIQMSGRAGRRGKDDRGYAIMLADAKLDEPTCRSMVKGSAAPLMSSFKLTYYTLLNLLKRLEGQGRDMEYVISKSFSQFQHEKELPERMEKAAALRLEAEKINIGGGGSGGGTNGDSSNDTAMIEKFIAAQKDVESAQRVIMDAVLRPDKCIHFLRAGRIVRARNDSMDFGYGVVVTVIRNPILKQSNQESNNSAMVAAGGKNNGGSGKNYNSSSNNGGGGGGGGGADPAGAVNYTADLLLCAKFIGKDQIAPCSLDDPEGELLVVPVPLPLLCMLSTLRIAIPSDLTDSQARDSVRTTLKELVSRYPGGVLPELDPITDIGISDPEVVEAVKKEKEARAILKKLSTKSTSSKAKKKSSNGKDTAATTNEENEEEEGGLLAPGVDYEAELRRKAQLLMEADSIEREMHHSQLSHFKEESNSRLKVLKKLGHVDFRDGMVTLKGKAASAIDTADELLTSELMFDGTFGSLDKHQLAALVSCLVPVENTNAEIQLQKPLAHALGKLQQTARHIAETSTECKLPVDADEYVDKFKATLMNVVYEWSKGASFRDICDITDVFEGSIIR
jgi:ATP-dependent RNA helicase DOB1